MIDLFRRLDMAKLAASAGVKDPGAKEAQETMRQVLGLLWDRDTVAFYGDPAFDARFATPAHTAVTTHLERTGPRTHRLVIRFADAEAAAKGAPDLAVLFTQRIAKAALTKNAPAGTVLADDFILVRSPKPTAGAVELAVDFEGDVIP